MADVTKVSLTKFEADPSQFIAAFTAMEQKLQDVEKELAAVKAQQDEVGKKAKDNSKQFASSFGEMADGIGKLVPGFDKISGGFKKAEGAAKQFGIGTKSAIAATGIGALIVLVGTLISKFGELREKPAEDLTYLEDRFVRLGKKITGQFGAALSGIWQNIKQGAVNAAEAMGILNKETDAQVAAHDKLNAQIKAADKARAEGIAKQEQEVALAKARKDTSEEIYQAELKLLELRKADKDTMADKEAIQKQIDILNAGRLAFLREEKKALEEKTQATYLDNLAEQEKARIAQLNADAELEQIFANEAAQAAADEERKKRQDEYLASLGAIHALNVEVAEARKAEADAAIAHDKAVAESKAAQSNAVNQLAQESKVAAVALALRDTYNSVMAVMKDPSIPFTVLRLALAGFVGAMGLRNVKKIASSKFADGGVVPAGGGMIRGRRHYQGGVKFHAGGQLNEAEGGEFIVNRKATRRFLPQLRAINAVKYADGGILAAQADLSRLNSNMMSAASSQRSVLVLEDYRRANNRLEVVESLARA